MCPHHNCYRTFPWVSFAGVFWNITIVLMSSKNCVSSGLKSERTTLVLVSYFFHKLHPTQQVMCNFFSNTDGTTIPASRLLPVSCNIPVMIPITTELFFPHPVPVPMDVPEDAQVHWFHIPFPFSAGKFITMRVLPLSHHALLQF